MSDAKAKICDECGLIHTGPCPNCDASESLVTAFVQGAKWAWELAVTEFDEAYLKDARKAAHHALEANLHRAATIGIFKVVKTIKTVRTQVPIALGKKGGSDE